MGHEAIPTESELSTTFGSDGLLNSSSTMLQESTAKCLSELMLTHGVFYEQIPASEIRRVVKVAVRTAVMGDFPDTV